MRTYIFLILILVLSGCQEKIFTGNVNCDECYTDKPDSAALYIDVTINDKYKAVPLVIYNGEVENDQVEWIDTTHISDYWVWVAVDRYYSVKVEYASDKDTIYVIDATKIKKKRVSDACDDACWVIVDKKIDATIKFK